MIFLYWTIFLILFDYFVHFVYYSSVRQLSKRRSGGRNFPKIEGIDTTRLDPGGSSPTELPYRRETLLAGARVRGSERDRSADGLHGSREDTQGGGVSAKTVELGCPRRLSLDSKKNERILMDASRSFNPDAR